MKSGDEAAVARRQTFLPYAKPSIGEAEIQEVVDSLRTGWISTGEKVGKFEEAFARYVGTDHAIAVSSCTAGLEIALTVLGVGAGDEVLVPTLTFCSTAHVVVHRKARPVLVDVEADCNVGAEALEAAITPKTKAIMVVHYGGQACDLDAVYAVARRNRLPVVEDAAHAVGSGYRGHRIGAVALHREAGIPAVTVFSFYATKNLTTGEGGMIATADAELAKEMRLLANHGMDSDAWQRYGSAGKWFYEVKAAGYKSNMTDIQASLGIHQLRRLEDFNRLRRQYARQYDSAFAAAPEIESPAVHADRLHAYHLYVILLKLDALKIDRGGFVRELRARNIGTSVHFIPVHLHKYYREAFGYRRGDFPKAEALYSSIISLPLYPTMSSEDVRYVSKSVLSVVEQFRI